MQSCVWELYNQILHSVCLVFSADVGVPGSFGKWCAAKDLAQHCSQSRPTSQVCCMWQKQMSKPNSVSVLLGKTHASRYLSLALILQGIYQQIIFIYTNIFLKQLICRKFAGTDHYISNEKRKQWKPNQKETVSICHWSQWQFMCSFSKKQTQHQRRGSALCAIYISKQKDCFSQTIVTWNKLVWARPSTNPLLCNLFYMTG